ncbi:hypothetical protein R3P38DRAFT_1790562 [Favolaschia claudopus]|uniref:Uncharacterized protein n=1 Tax=Favolaschia claudopus TaxID=2862362 RepID=A0AAW0A5A3_9AGAR
MPMSRKSRRLAATFVSAILLICWAILFFAATRENSNSVQRKLLSRITQETPISGFYGPGAWWGFLITLGMTHGHAAMAIYKEERIPPDWDYDLTSAAFYVSVAAVDLVLKSRTISQLEDPASQSNLIPALVCAERVVSLGTGSLLFSTLISLVYGSSSRTSSAYIPCHNDSLDSRTVGFGLLLSRS